MRVVFFPAFLYKGGHHRLLLSARHGVREKPAIAPIGLPLPPPPDRSDENAFRHTWPHVEHKAVTSPNFGNTIPKAVECACVRVARACACVSIRVVACATFFYNIIYCKIFLKKNCIHYIITTVIVVVATVMYRRRFLVRTMRVRV